MLGIHHLFFIKFMGIFAGTLLLASFISYLTLKDIVIVNNEHQLQSTINLLALQLEKRRDYTVLAQEVKERTGFRFTLVDHNGTVIAESDHDIETMENHGTRKEILLALTEPYGVAIRYSSTVKNDFLYVAKSLTINHQTYYLRLAMSLEKVFESFHIFWYRMIIAVGFFILLSMIIPYQMSKKIRYDIDQIIRYLEELSEKNYHAVLQTRYFNEFLQISVMLKSLAKKLSNRARQKRKHAAKLRLINKQRSDLLSAISHEFKNPIASITGYAETLCDDPHASSEIREKFLRKIISNALKISTMLDRLALSVKLENNDLSIKPSSFVLSDSVLEIVDSLKNKHRDRVIRFEGVPVTVYADKTMIELVVTNLIDNALKYSQEEVRVVLTPQRLSVIDHGIGIPEKEIKKITSKFYRVQKNTWDNSMGLGLAIVEYILKIHRSALQIDSQPSVGSTFSFDITPLKPNE